MNSLIKNYGQRAFGGGVGLRHRYLQEIIDTKPSFNWFEVIVEDFFDIGGADYEKLMSISENYQLIAHGVCLSIGSTDPLDFDYLDKLKSFVRAINSPWTSDHLCFTRVDHANLNDLMPLPYTRECLNNVVERIKVVQDYIETPFLIENISRYITPSDREMSELDFLNEVIELSGCGLLLDITNVYLNAHHHAFDAKEYISKVPVNKVAQIHLSGWEPDAKGRLIDSHDAAVPEVIWDLYRDYIRSSGPTSVLIEWDKDFPDLEILKAEADKANSIMAQETS